MTRITFSDALMAFVAVGSATIMSLVGYVAVTQEKLHETSGPIRVNGEVPGEVWYTDDVSGEAEFMHIGGRTEVRPVTKAWVRVDTYQGVETIDIGFFGMARKNYNFFRLSQPLPETDNGTDDWHFVVSDKTSFYEGKAIGYQARWAMVVMKDNRPAYVVFHQEETDGKNLRCTATFGGGGGG